MIITRLITRDHLRFMQKELHIYIYTFILITIYIGINILITYI